MENIEAENPLENSLTPWEYLRLSRSGWQEELSTMNYKFSEEYYENDEEYSSRRSFNTVASKKLSLFLEKTLHYNPTTIQPLVSQILKNRSNLRKKTCKTQNVLAKWRIWAKNGVADKKQYKIA